jgi:D-alanine-D-alanine ligase
VVTGQQIMQALAPATYEVVPLYITREGKWFTGDGLRDLKHFQDGRVTERKDVQPVLFSPDVRHHGLILNPLPSGLFAKSQVLKLDVAFPAIHGSHGEDGTLQGLFELADMPYVGFATLGSALTNDKIMTKQILRQHQIQVVDDVYCTRAEWHDQPAAVLERVQTALGYPVFVKPATLGSSIGVTRADDEATLRIALDIAANFDRRILIEKAVVGGIEINCAVLGDEQNVQTSVLEQPVFLSDLLSYEDKYLRGGGGMKGAERIIPAPLSAELTEQIQTITRNAFQAVDGRGIARVDFLVKPDTQQVYLNEMNTLPGSLAFYLWEATNLRPAQLVDRLVDIARQAQAEKRRNMYDYQSNLLSLAAARGLKGTKGSKGHNPQSPETQKTTTIQS